MQEATVIQQDENIVVKINSSTSIMEYVTLLCIFAVLLILLFMLVKIYKGSGANYTIGEDEARYITTTETKSSVLRKTSIEKIRFDNNNAGKIRKLYYRKMNSRISNRRIYEARRMTPKELADNFHIGSDKEEIKKLTEYYKKARYSNEECKDEDVTASKGLL